MAVSASFLSACRTAIALRPEVATFQAALTAFERAGEADRLAKWMAAWDNGQSDLSPAYRLRRAIREVVNTQADADASVSLLDREAAYRTLDAESVPVHERPLTESQEAAALLPAVLHKLLS